MGKIKTIYLVTGKKRSGKDYLSDLMLDELNNSVTAKFSGLMKSITQSLFSIDSDQLEEYKNDETILIGDVTKVRMDSQSLATHLVELYDIFNNSFIFGEHDKININYDIVYQVVKKVMKDTKVEDITFRKWLQIFGTDITYPLFGDDIWARYTSYEINQLLKKHDSVIVSDFRFPHEYEVVNSMANNLYKLVTIKVIDHNLEDSSDSHISENALSGFHFDKLLDNSVKNGEEPIRKWINEIIIKGVD